MWTLESGGKRRLVEKELSNRRILLAFHPQLGSATRRSQILSALKNGRKLRTRALAAELGCSIVTAKRELDGLRGQGTVEFVGPAKLGLII